MVGTVIGYVLPVILAPAIAYGLRYPFAIFLCEGDELFSHRFVSKRDAVAVSSQLATVNVIVLLLTWLAFFSCHSFKWLSHDWNALVAVGGVLAALLITVLLVHISLGLHGWTLWGVGMLSFMGGNLPLVLVVPLLMLFL